MRQRMIKPEFFVDDRLLECSMSARLAFVSTWCIADDKGNLERSTKQIRRLAFPDETNESVESWILELIDQGLLLEYSWNGDNYLHIKGFAKHQRIDKPSKPRCPEFDESLLTPRALQEHSKSTPAQVKLREEKLKEGNQNQSYFHDVEKEEAREENFEDEELPDFDFLTQPRNTPTIDEWLRYFSVHGLQFGLSEEKWRLIYATAEACGWRTKNQQINNWKMWGAYQARYEAQNASKRDKEADMIQDLLKARGVNGY